MEKAPIENSKECLRKAMRKKRAELPRDERLKLSILAAKSLVSSNAWKIAKTVFLYTSVKGELDTDFLFFAAREQGKRVGMPLCLEEKGKMVFAVCDSPEHLTRGCYGLLEPLPDREHIVTPGRALAVVPGTAFTLSGERLGQGGGYYDRYFSSNVMKDVVRVGYCYSFQIVPELKSEPWDLPVHMLCTEQGLFPVK